MCPVSKFDKKIPKGSVPNWQLQICNHYGNRWCKCKLKPPKTDMCPPKKFFFLLSHHGSPHVGSHLGISAEIRKFWAQYLSPQSPYSQKVYIFRICGPVPFSYTPTCPLWTSIGKVKFFTCSPSPAANTRRKKRNLTYSESVDPARQCQMAFVQIPY